MKYQKEMLLVMNQVVDVYKRQVLDSNKKVVYTDLVSDSNGRIEISNIVPGKYYVEEIKTKERIC